MDPSQRRRERLLLPLAIVAACAAATVFAVVRQADRAEGLVAREDAALRALEDVAAAEEAYRKRGPAYGWLHQLAAAGLLPGVDGVEERGEPRVLSTDGYGIEVLLPVGRTATGGMRIALPGGAPVDAALAASQFVVLARPTDPGESGLRTWYVDARGVVRYADGVIDSSGRPRSPLPQSLVDRDGTGEGTGDLWSSRPK